MKSIASRSSVTCCAFTGMPAESNGSENVNWTEGVLEPEDQIDRRPWRERRQFLEELHGLEEQVRRAVAPRPLQPHLHAAVAEHPQPVAGGAGSDTAAPDAPGRGPPPTRWRAGRSPRGAPGVAPEYQPRRCADPRIGAP